MTEAVGDALDVVMLVAVVVAVVPSKNGMMNALANGEENDANKRKLKTQENRKKKSRGKSFCFPFSDNNKEPRFSLLSTLLPPHFDGKETITHYRRTISFAKRYL